MMLINFLRTFFKPRDITRLANHPAEDSVISRQWRYPLLLLLCFSAITHFGFLNTPHSVVYDEVHFGKYTTAYCCTGENIFDVHPPHAKLLIAGMARLAGYTGGFDFKSIGEQYHDVPVYAYRLLPAIAGFLLTIIIYLLVRQLGGSESAAFFTAALYTLDNALLVETRFILLDGILLLGIFSALSAYLGAMQTDHRSKRIGLLLLAGGMAGLAIGSKFTGLTAAGLIVLIVMVRIMQDHSTANLRNWLGSLVWVTPAALSVYLFGWFLHFQLLDKPGFGDAFYLYSGNFFTDLLQLHKIMFITNNAITVSHPDASPWWSWPLMTTPPYYWSGDHASIYLLGNPVIWWGTTLLGIVICSNLLLRKVTTLTWQTSSQHLTLWIPLAGYLIATVPYALVKRPLFMYHYLPSLLFALLFVVLWLDSAGWFRNGGVTTQRKSYFFVLAVTVLVFLFLTSLTYGYPHPAWYTKIMSAIFPKISH